MAREVLRETYSLCPVCMKRIAAENVTYDGVSVRMEKTCPEHGDFSTVIWRGKESYLDWIYGMEPLAGEPEHCPDSCGICEKHRQGTCCVLLEVTDRCDMSCPYCFADGKGSEPSFEEVCREIDAILTRGRVLIQFSGGEPTMRDDLPEIVAYAKSKGASYVQLNSNGLRLSYDEEYVKRLHTAGLSFVFMQFDGVTDEVFRTIRGRPLLREKLAAIDMCSKYEIGVTLVPVIVPGLNDGQIGDIIRLGVSLSPAVRGVHFQPVSYFGRYPAPPEDDMRYTLDDLLSDICEQSGGLIERSSITPSHCDHAMCGLHGAFIAYEGRLVPLKKDQGGESCCCVTAEQNRNFVGKRWQRPLETACCNADIETLDGFLKLSREHAFTVTAMAFQDAYNVDLERLLKCSMHVRSDGRFMPFCAKYITDTRGVRLFDGAHCDE